MIDSLVQELRYAVRSLANSPGFTLVAILTLALGIGVNTSIFSVLYGVLLEPLPYDHPERLVRVFETSGRLGTMNLSRLDFQDWRDQNRSFTHLAAYGAGPVTLIGGSEPDRVLAAAVTPGFFEAFGVPAFLGRTFGADAGVSGLPAVISERLWRSRFGGARDVLGRTIRLIGSAYTVVGVLPSRMDFPTGTGVWIPLDLSTDISSRSAHNYAVVGALKPGVSVGAAQADLASVAARLAEQYPKSNQNVGAHIRGLQEHLTGSVRPTLLLLSIMVALVLLIACANVANLLLACAHARRREIAVRAALGATRTRLARQVLTESALLGLGGAAAGALFAIWTGELFAAWGPLASLPMRARVTHPAVLGFALGLALVTAVLFGATPAVHATRSNLVESLKQSSGRGLTAQGLRGALVVAQVALAALLLVGAGLTTRSLLRLQQERLGFDPEHVLLVDAALPETGADDAARAQAYGQLLEQVGALPGVQSAALASALPLTGNDPDGFFDIEGRSGELGTAGSSAGWHMVSDGYFATLGVPVRRGRGFLPTDRGGIDVVVINEAMARVFWPDQDPIGRRIAITGLDLRTYNAFRAGRTVWFTIVGVVGDVRHQALGTPPGPDLYVPYFQHPSRDVTLVVRTPLPLASLQGALKNKVRALSPDAPLRLTTLVAVITRSVATPRFRSLLIGIFAALALVLAAVGIYGVVSYLTTQRTAEIGIRMALGARPRHVLGAVAGGVAGQALAGLALGLGLAAGFSRLVATFLYGVPPTDAPTYEGVAVVLVGVALLACYLPARRAAKIDPIIALRTE